MGADRLKGQRAAVGRYVLYALSIKRGIEREGVRLAGDSMRVVPRIMIISVPEYRNCIPGRFLFLNLEECVFIQIRPALKKMA